MVGSADILGKMDDPVLGSDQMLSGVEESRAVSHKSYYAEAMLDSTPWNCV